jgi:hypothetical protein
MEDDFLSIWGVDPTTAASSSGASKRAASSQQDEKEKALPPGPKRNRAGTPADVCKIKEDGQPASCNASVVATEAQSSASWLLLGHDWELLPVIFDFLP